MPNTTAGNNDLSVIGAIEERRREVALKCAVEAHAWGNGADDVLNTARRYEQYLKTGETNAG